jgi:hypothetical protein
MHHHRAVGNRRSAEVVSAAPNGQVKPGAANESDRRRHVVGIGASHDRHWSPIDITVPYSPGAVVGGVSGHGYPAGQFVGEWREDR